MNTLAIDIGGTKFSIALFQDERMILRQSHATQRDGGRAWMLEQIVSLAKQWRKDAGFERCEVGFGGPVDFTSQQVTTSNVVADWQGFGLAAFLQDEIGVPAVIDNDANVGALGEALYGAGAGYDPLLYITLSTGIGGGFIAGGQVYRGADSFAGEIGHIPVRPDGPLCACGAQGCLERMCSGIWLQTDHGRTAKELLSSPAFVERYVVDLALGLKSAILLLNPARIVIGGGISKAGDALFEPLRAELHRQITSWSRARIDVVPAKLGDDSVLYGCLALAGASALSRAYEVHDLQKPIGSSSADSRSSSVRDRETSAPQNRQAFMSYCEEYRTQLLRAIESIDISKIDQAIEWMRQAREENKQIFTCGNGGSASTASHFVADMVKGASYGHARRFRVHALTDSLSTLTAYANDVTYDCVFAEQLKNFAAPGDLLLCISGSGNSPNVIAAAQYAREAGCRILTLTGRDGGNLAPLADIDIRIEHQHMGRIEDLHLMVCHMMSYAFMKTEQ